MRLVEYLHFYLIEDFFPEGIAAGFSRPCLKGEDILSDIQIIQREAGYEYEKLEVAYLSQKHSPDTIRVAAPGVYTGDGLFTDRVGLSLVVRTADCLPVFLFDTQTSSIGMVHMGWRSALGGILGNMPVNIPTSFVVAGVGLRRCCFEVGDAFRDYGVFSSYLSETKKGRLHFDPVGFLLSTLLKEGMSQNNFCDIKICSLCGKEGFFSYRRDRTQLRTLSFIMKI